MPTPEPQAGIYRHYKNDKLYQLLFIAEFWGLTAVEAETRLAVVIDYDYVRHAEDGGGVPFLRVEDATDDPTVCTVPLLMGRAHCRIEPGEAVCVYVPRYPDVPGLGVSVRPLREWVEMVSTGCKGELYRFEYVGETAPPMPTKKVIDVEGFLTWLAEQTPCCSCCGSDDEYKHLIITARAKLTGAA